MKNGAAPAANPQMRVSDWLASTAFLAALLVGASLQVSQAQSDQILKAQEQLEMLGLDPGPIDGFMGPMTRDALRAFQRDVGLAETGELDAVTLKALTIISRPDVGAEAEPGRALGFEQPTSEARHAPFALRGTAGALQGRAGNWKTAPGVADAPPSVAETPEPLVPAEIDEPGEVPPVSTEPAEPEPGAGSGSSRSDEAAAESPTPAVSEAPFAEKTAVPIDFPEPPEKAEPPSQGGIAEPAAASRDSTAPSGGWLWIGAVVLALLGLRQLIRSQRSSPTSVAATNEAQGAKSSLPHGAEEASSEPHRPRSSTSEPHVIPARNPAPTAAHEAPAPLTAQKDGANDRRQMLSGGRRGSSIPLSTWRPEVPAAPSVHRRERASRVPRWVPPDGSIMVAGREIGGMVYVGAPPNSRRTGRAENAVIDPGKAVAARGDDLAGRGLPYWPSYSDIDARCRATYLDWLAAGRKDPACGVGYVFLYFYGLERRYFVDDPDGSERARLVAEVERLLGIYDENGSVRRYFGAFLDAAPLLMPDARSPEPIFERRGYEMPLTVRVALGRMARDGVPLTADWLLCWLMVDPESRLRTPAERAFPEFRALFRQLFEEKYPEGLKVRTPKRRLKPEYPAASGTFETDLVPFVGEVPDVSGSSKPLSVAATITEGACQALDKFSRYLGRDPEGRGTLEGHALLPESLWKLFPCPEFEDLERWACERIEQGGLVPVTELIERMEGARPDRLGKRQLTDAADALARLSIGVAPDPRFSLRKPKAGEPVVLFSLPEGETQLEEVSEGYRSALLALALGSFVAHAGERPPLRRAGHHRAARRGHHAPLRAERGRQVDAVRRAARALLRQALQPVEGHHRASAALGRWRRRRGGTREGRRHLADRQALAAGRRGPRLEGRDALSSGRRGRGLDRPARRWGRRRAHRPALGSAGADGARGRKQPRAERGGGGAPRPDELGRRRGRGHDPRRPAASPPDDEAPPHPARPPARLDRAARAPRLRSRLSVPADVHRPHKAKQASREKAVRNSASSPQRVIARPSIRRSIRTTSGALSASRPDREPTLRASARPVGEMRA